MSFAGWELGLNSEKLRLVSVLEILPEAVGRRGQHFQARGHDFLLYRPTLIRQITMFISFIYLFIFSSSELGYK